MFGTSNKQTLCKKCLCGWTGGDITFNGRRGSIRTGQVCLSQRVNKEDLEVYQVFFTQNENTSGNNNDEGWLDYLRHELDKVNPKEEFSEARDGMHKAHRDMVSRLGHISGLCYKNQMEVYNRDKSLATDYVTLLKRNLGLKYMKSQMSRYKTGMSDANWEKMSNENQWEMGDVELRMITVRATHIRQIKDESEMPLTAHKRWTMMYRADIFLNNKDATSMIREGETLLVNYASSLMGDVQTM